MGNKEREISLSIEKLRVLVKRLPVTHPKWSELQTDLEKRLAGDNGEHSLEYPLSFLAKEAYKVKQSLRLQHEHYYFQMDFLVISKKFFVVIEVKNMKGELFFDQHFKQLIQKVEGRQKAYPDPLIQVNRHKSLLQGWLSQNQFADLPIIPLIVISNPHSLIRTNMDPEVLAQKVIHRDALPEKINLLDQNFQEDILSETELIRLENLLIKHHTPLDPKILVKYQINPSELCHGVLCPKCSVGPLLRIYGTWYCKRCQSKHKDAHIEALRDYALVINSTISNRQARSYLQIDSDSVVKRLLAKMNLPYKGEKKGRVYDLSSLRTGKRN
ncbi:nuclease-related domain-containing protein [Halalkalibacter krulwichiae]|uniref:Nuclease-related domain protein n=1 Tax=Halalkalibacter krulwichiae TaxID=199441 RepID=A0A1X9MKK3_9BACI|nr:nuclease-related domain-containing protein [Halalkalibacter krulwichiae]ARK32191.1 Nuclease-related domain protein [Halalkalibacter krulwichiae]